ncbi:carbohydrate kinase [Bacillus sp. SCS-151]|uniref:carbohydrate kinase n=1 Tax=Nanhaiella sioensis TaxID=3115293 RepID=UPI00397BCC84
MNEKEKYILHLISKNPYISQNELAETMKLSRSAIAGYVSSLTKQGKILGRAYVLPEASRITCIGGANVDRKAQSQESIQYGSSNPVSVTQSSGGVARNIAENIGRIGSAVSLVSVVGDDQEGEWLIGSTNLYVDTSQVMKLPKMNTGTYTAVLDQEGEMVIALADMAIYDSINDSFIEKRWSHITSSSIVLLDTNLPSHLIRKIIERCRQDNIKLCVAPVSAPKMKKLPNVLGGVTWLICNQQEAMTLVGECRNDRVMCEKIQQLGVENVIITRGERGIVYQINDSAYGEITAPTIDAIDVTGAGDAFVAGFLYAMNKGENFRKSCKYGMTCSMLTLQTQETVNNQLHEQLLVKTYQQYFEEDK